MRKDSKDHLDWYWGIVFIHWGKTLEVASISFHQFLGDLKFDHLGENQQSANPLSWFERPNQCQLGKSTEWQRQAGAVNELYPFKAIFWEQTKNHLPHFINYETLVYSGGRGGQEDLVPLCTARGGGGMPEFPLPPGSATRLEWANFVKIFQNIVPCPSHALSLPHTVQVTYNHCPASSVLFLSGHIHTHGTFKT